MRWLADTAARGDAASLATFLHRSKGSRNTERSCLRYYGRASERIEPGNPFGQGAQHLAEVVYGGGTSGLELIRRHTLLGLFGPAMDEAWWGNRFRSPIAEGVATRKFGPEPWLGKPLSWCAAADLGLFRRKQSDSFSLSAQARGRTDATHIDRALIYMKGWMLKDLAAHWRMSPENLSRIIRSADRSPVFDEAVLGLPTRRHGALLDSRPKIKAKLISAVSG